jgi:hypothetical protein
MKKTMLVLPVWLGCVAILGAAPSLSAPAAPTKKAADEVGIVLKQQLGDSPGYIVQVTATAVRVENPKNGFYVISRAPDWQVYFVRPKTKEMRCVSYKDWCHKCEFCPLSWTATLKKPVSTLSSVRNGMHFVKYLYGPSEDLGSVIVSREEYDKHMAPSKASRSEIYCIEVAGAEMTGPIVGRLQNLPPVSGLVLSANRVLESGEVRAALSTQAMKTGVNISP